MSAPPTVGATRREQARELRRAGLQVEEIAQHLGVHRSTVGGWVRDLSTRPGIARRCDSCDEPYTAYRRDSHFCSDKCRKDSYRGTCRNCGAQTDGSGGIGKAPEHCHRCAPAVHAKWSPESIADAIREWTRRYGEPPTATNWNTSDPSHDPEKWAAGEWPHVNSVQYHCGTWNDAIRSAGFEPRIPRNGGVGHGPGSVTDEQRQHTVALVEEHGLKGAAQLLGLTPDGVRVRLRRANRMELVVPSRLSPTEVMGREVERLEREIEEAEARVTEKRAAIEEYHAAIKVLSSTNGKAS